MTTSDHQLQSPSSGSAPRLLPSLILIVVAALLVYSTTFSAPFELDDYPSIVENPAIHDLGNFLHGAGYAYNPRRFVAYLSFALNYRFGGLNVFGYHLVNLIIHIASGFLVYALASLALRAGTRDQGSGTGKSALTDPWSLIPLFAALLFVVHPIQTQAVTYIVQRTASLAALFYLAAMVCYAKGREQGPGTGDREQRKAEDENSQKPFLVPGPRSRIIWFFLALVCGILAIKTKENAVTLPLAIILYEFVFYGFSRKKLAFLLIGCIAGAVAAGLFLVQNQDHRLLSDSLRASSVSISRWEYLVTQFAVIATYLRLLVLPINQNLDYDYPVYNSLAQARPLLGLLLHLSLIAVAFWCWWRAHTGTRDRGPGASAISSPFTIHHSLIAFGILWFYLTLSVESSFIPIQDVIAEHRLYLPSVGMLLAAASAMLVLVRSQRQFLLLAGVVVCLLAGAGWSRNLVWRSEAVLWRDTGSKSPDKPRVLMALGNVEATAGNREGAKNNYSRALERDPGYFMAHLNLGVLQLHDGNLDGALFHLQRARDLAPNLAPAYFHLGQAYCAKGLMSNGILFLSRAVDLAPYNQNYRQALAAARSTATAPLSR